MINAIIYRSICGSTKRYAEMLSHITGLPALPFDKPERADGEVFYMGCVTEGRISSFMRATEGLRIVGACAVGISKREQSTLAEIKRATGITDGRVRLFYARGALYPEKLCGARQLMLSGALKSAERQEDGELAGLLRDGCDFVSEDNIRPAAEWIAWRNKNQRM